MIGKNKVIYIKNNSKACPICKKKIKGFKEFESKEIKLRIPVWNCTCFEDRRNLKKAAEYKKRIDYLFKYSNIDKEFLENDFKVHRPELIEFFQDFAWIKEGKQLLIYGDPGNHKTGQVTAIMKQAIREKMYKCLYFRATDLIHKWKEEKNILNCDLLVVDNFAKESEENRRGMMFDILDKRIHNRLSNILIVNSELERIRQIYGNPMISRLSGFIQIEIDGEDKRQEKDFRYGGE